MTVKEWLATPCTEDEVATLDDGAEYIPIGILEGILDDAPSPVEWWGTEGFRFSIFKTASYWFASGSVELVLMFNDGSKRSMQGACTMNISSADTNMDYEATILSFCVANAAKKLGKRFGRHLNGRMEKGETAVKLTPSPEALQTEEEISNSFAKVKEYLQAIVHQKDAEEYLNKTEFRYNVELKMLVAQKPNK